QSAICNLQSNFDHHFAMLRKLDSIADQVDDDLPQPAGITDQVVGDVGEDVAGQLQALFVRAQGEGLHRIAEAVAEREGDVVQIELARFDLGEVENVVDDIEERIR